MSVYVGVKHVKRVIFQKHIDYRDESEYRVIALDKTIEYIDISKSIKAVIASTKTPNITLIKKLCADIQCELLKAHYEPTDCIFHLLPVS